MKTVFVFPPVRKHLAGGHDQSSHGSWAGFTFEEQKGVSGTTLSMKDNNGKTLATALYVKSNDIEIQQIDSYDEGKGYATKLLTKIYDSFPNKIIFWGKTISPASTHLAEKFNSNYGRTLYIPWGDGSSEDKKWGEEYGQSEPIKKHLAGQHDQSSHGSWATANGYKLASTDDLPSLDSANYDSTVRNARDNYVGFGYTWMNAYLRDGYIEDTVKIIMSDEISKDEAIAQIDSLKSALYESQTTQDLTVTRWTRTGESILGEKISETSNLESLIGKTYNAKGFTSTSAPSSLHSSVNDSYKSTSKVLVNIHMPAGTYGATVGNDKESEFILAPDTFFVVMGANDLGEGRISLDLLVTGQGDG
jgi:hypothetical protein